MDWRIGGTKIERTRARYIVLPSGHINLRKIDFWGETLRTRKFSTGKFFGAATQASLRNQDSENIVILGDQASVSKSQQLKVIE